MWRWSASLAVLLSALFGLVHTWPAMEDVRAATDALQDDNDPRVAALREQERREQLVQLATILRKGLDEDARVRLAKLLRVPDQV